jgi:transcriptional regulator with PAS, ATPase and Fis domain
LPETILEAELFGSIKGAFTGAVDKQGLFEAAEGGTLFLDEIQDTSEAMQMKLLRTLQEREIRRVGSTKPISVNVRLICATNEDIQELIKKNRLRQDFYYRINVVTINMPPLRERRQDIPILATHLLEKYCRLKNKNIKGFDQHALRAMTEYDWVENNVRELENEIERAVIFTDDGKQIGLSDLSEKVQGVRKHARAAAKIFVDEDEKALNHAQFEREYIQFILAKAGGNKSKAAKLMGLPRTTLIGKMNKYGLK